MNEEIKVILDNMKIADAELGSCAKEIEDYIDNLLKMVEQGEHYKHLYSSVKKQKDDVVEYINSKTFEENFPYVANECQVKSTILRMLGEIDEKIN